MTDLEIAEFLQSICQCSQCVKFSAIELLHRYVMETGYWQVADWRFRLVLVDFAIHVGVQAAGVALQRACGLPSPDGALGRSDFAKIARLDPLRGREFILAEHLRVLGQSRLALVLVAA